jgi:hypothetical protein
MPLKEATGRILSRSQFFTFCVSGIAVAIFGFFFGIVYAKGDRAGELVAGFFLASHASIAILAGTRFWKTFTDHQAPQFNAGSRPSSDD